MTTADSSTPDSFPGDPLQGMRVLVIGASAGIGRMAGVLAAQRGARVAFSARRAEKLEEVVASLGANGANAIAAPCNVRDEASIEHAVAQTVDAFGGLDAVIYATGMSPLTTLADADGEAWREVLETNVIGAALVTRHVLPHLQASSGVVAYLGSNSVELAWPGIGLYTTSKAALDKLIRAWRNEHTDVRFSRVVVGPTDGTEFSASWDPVKSEQIVTSWIEKGLMTDHQIMKLEHMANEVLSVLASPVYLWEVFAMPPSRR